MDAKDYPLPPPATYEQPQRRRGVCCCVSLCLCSILTTLVATFGIAVLVFYIVVHPQDPKYDVELFQLTGLPNRTLSTTDAAPDTTILLQIMNRNPNKKAAIYYDDSYVSVILRVDGISVGTTTISAYSQSKKTTTTLNPAVSISKETSSTLLGSRYNLRDWRVQVKLDVNARLKVGSTNTSKLKVRARCDLNVDVLSSPERITRKICWVDS